MNLPDALELITSRKDWKELFLRPVDLQGTGRAMTIHQKALVDADSRERVDINNVYTLQLQWEVLTPTQLRREQVELETGIDAG